jgi:ribosomal-protein-alanine N-acetyltransferase
MVAADFSVYQALMSDYEVVKMSLSYPWPPEPDYTRMRFEQANEPERFVKAITENGVFAGQIGLAHGEVWYLLAQAHWGKGIATWAVQQILALGFSALDLDKITAGTWHDNPASMRVLEKCGFRKTGEATLFCKPRGCDVSGPDYEITRYEWESQNE